MVAIWSYLIDNVSPKTWSDLICTFWVPESEWGKEAILDKLVGNDKWYQVNPHYGWESGQILARVSSHFALSTAKKKTCEKIEKRKSSDQMFNFEQLRFFYNLLVPPTFTKDDQGIFSEKVLISAATALHLLLLTSGLWSRWIWLGLFEFTH